MTHRALVTYASYSGSTSEIANEIAVCLIEAGLSVDVCPMWQVKVLNGYWAVVLGTAIRREKPLPEAIDFVNRFRVALQHIPIAVFSVGVDMRRDTPENREKTLLYLKPLLQEINQPVDIGLFAGKLDTGELSMWWRVLAPRDESGKVKEGDWRDWGKIRQWGVELSAKIVEKNNRF
jgi:menaquinone-dependent protoporphyrinogen oxidase